MYARSTRGHNAHISRGRIGSCFSRVQIRHPFSHSLICLRNIDAINRKVEDTEADDGETKPTSEAERKEENAGAVVFLLFFWCSLSLFIRPCVSTTLFYFCVFFSLIVCTATYVFFLLKTTALLRSTLVRFVSDDGWYGHHRELSPRPRLRLCPFGPDGRTTTMARS